MALEQVLLALCGVYTTLLVLHVLLRTPLLKLPPKAYGAADGRGRWRSVDGGITAMFLVCAISIVVLTLWRLPSPSLGRAPSAFVHARHGATAAWLASLCYIFLDRLWIRPPVRAFTAAYCVLSAASWLLNEGTAPAWLRWSCVLSVVPVVAATAEYLWLGPASFRMRLGERGGVDDVDDEGDGAQENGETQPLLPSESKPAATAADAPPTEDKPEGIPARPVQTYSSDTATKTRRSFRGTAQLPPSPYTHSAISLLIFSYMTPIIALGGERQVDRDDLPIPAPRIRAGNVGRQEFGRLWEEELQGESTSLTRALARVFGVELLLSGLLKLGNDACNFVQPLLLQQIIQFMQLHRRGEAALWQGVALALALMLSYLLQSASFNQYFNAVNVVSVRTRSALSWTVFNKTCKLSTEGRSKFSSGAVQNLMTNDARRIADLMAYLNYLWSGVLQIGVASVLLVRFLGVLPSVLGFGLCALNSPLQAHIMSVIRSARESALRYTDDRQKILSEIFQGIKVVKLYAWEESFIARTLDIRADELRWIRRAMVYSAWSWAMISSLPVMLSTVAIGSYVLLGNPLDASVLFPSIALLNVLRAPLTFLPNVLISVAQAKASINRLEAFLRADEIRPPTAAAQATLDALFANESLDVVAEHASFAWDRAMSAPHSAGPILQDVNLRVNAGELCMVIGATGSGKSSLLAGMLHEAYTVRGVCAVRRQARVAYVDQTAFIFNATLKDNVLFGYAYDEARYRNAVRVAALEHDLALLPAGDDTEIGGRGVNLSGGQRQRVSLARAVYSDADVYVLDDPLSAVDAHVGSQIFRECIVGALRGKTRVFVTNQLQLLSSPQVAQVVLLSGGSVREKGRYAELMARGGDFAALIRSQGDISEAHNADEEAEAAVKAGELATDKLSAAAAEDADAVKAPPAAAAAAADDDDDYDDDDDADEAAGANTGAGDDRERRGALTVSEARRRGRVELENYLLYVRAFGGVWVAVALVSLLAMVQVLSMTSNFWLSLWSADAIKPSPGFRVYFGGYVGLGVLSVIFSGIATLSLALAALRAARQMHESMLRRVMRTPMYWFDQTPVGRLLNRFSADVDKIDSTLMQALQGFLRQFLNLTGIVVLILFTTPLFFVPLAVVSVGYFFVQEFYRRASVDLRRLEAVTRSPLYNHFSETLDGLITLRAYRQMWRAVQINERMVDELILVMFTNLCANRWLSVLLELMSTALIFCASLFATLAGSSLSPAFAGLMLSYALQLTGCMTWVIRQFTEAESQMSSVERVAEYSLRDDLPQETNFSEQELLASRSQRQQPHPPHDGGGDVRVAAPPPTRSRSSWPRSGRIEFEHVSMRYRRELPAVLHDVSFSVCGGERIGICGRTGAGKSSLLNVLFRLHPLESGRVVIDDVDTAEVSLQALRSTLSIIPQEPLIFSGSFRSNLDPFHQHADAELWRVLNVCNLSDVVSLSGGGRGLDTPVSEGGSNLSVGQRQLLCLGRAMLRRSAILVLDEATAAVDVHTDEMVQRTLDAEFRHCTLLTIAHRINTIISYDRILVLEGGRVAEYDTPQRLLAEPRSAFSSMVDELGPSVAKRMRDIASGAAAAEDEGGGGGGARSFVCGKGDGGGADARERVQRAFWDMREAILNHNSVVWDEQLSKSGLNRAQWNMQLDDMAGKLYELSRIHLQPQDLKYAVEDDDTLDFNAHERGDATGSRSFKSAQYLDHEQVPTVSTAQASALPSTPKRRTAAAPNDGRSRVGEQRTHHAPPSQKEEADTGRASSSTNRPA